MLANSLQQQIDGKSTAITAKQAELTKARNELTKLQERRTFLDAEIARLEVHYLANPEDELRFALLSDWRDAPAETMPGASAGRVTVRHTCQGVAPSVAASSASRAALPRSSGAAHAKGTCTSSSDPCAGPTSGWRPWWSP